MAKGHARTIEKLGGYGNKSKRQLGGISKRPKPTPKKAVR